MSTNHSTGPRTPEGKAVSSQNARKHGLAAESIPADLQPVFNDLRNELRSQCRPDGPLEEIFFDKLVAARWNMLRALDFENELYDRSEGRDPITHPATQKEAELYSRYYIRYEGSFNRAYKQLKDSQTNRICQLIEANPDAPRPSLPLADALKIQLFAKRTPPPRTAPVTEPPPSGTAAPSDDILTHFPPSVATEIRDDADALGITVNFLLSQYAKIGYQTAREQCAQNEPNLSA
ncbi:MAG: hypothetical protein IT168_11255 [Bryobacterales bacterium]|nr:hypothetical protein [Bryobacterales bacterium]